MKTINFIPKNCIGCQNTILSKDVVKAQMSEQSVQGTYHCGKCQLLMIVKLSPKTYLAGILMGSFQDPQFVQTYDKNDKGMIDENLGITAITPAYKLRELLFSGNALSHRQLLQEEPKKNTENY